MKILLISEKKRVFEKTESITRGWAEIIWYKYDDLKRNEYPVVNAVIIQFDNKILCPAVSSFSSSLVNTFFKAIITIIKRSFEVKEPKICQFAGFTQ